MNKENSNYCILLLEIIFTEINKEEINGIAWSSEKYEDIYIFNLNIFDNFIKDFKKQNFIGITLGKYEEPAHVLENI